MQRARHLSHRPSIWRVAGRGASAIDRHLFFGWRPRASPRSIARRAASFSSAESLCARERSNWFDMYLRWGVLRLCGCAEYAFRPASGWGLQPTEQDTCPGMRTGGAWASQRGRGMRNPPYTMLTRHDAVVRRVGRCEKPRGPSQDSLVGMRSATACVRPRVRLHDALEWRASVASVLVSDGGGCVMCTSSGVLVEHACDWLMVVRTYLRGQQHHHRPGRMTHRRGTAAAADVRRAAQCACCTCATVRVCNLELRRERKRARHGGLTWAADPIRSG